MAAAKTQSSDLKAARKHVEDAARLVSRGGDHVHVAIHHLALALNDLIGQLDG